MKKITNASIPIILTFSLVLLLSTGSANIYGQLIDQTNQTSGQNTTEQTNQQQLTQTNQTQQQANQSKQQDPELDEKLLNYTNAAILALNDDDIGAAQDNLVQIQNELINASGKQVVIIPAPAIPSDEEDSD
jgi:predicted PurR-regulated permease PerM